MNIGEHPKELQTQESFRPRTAVLMLSNCAYSTCFTVSHTPPNKLCSSLWNRKVQKDEIVQLGMSKPFWLNKEVMSELKSSNVHNLEFNDTTEN